MFFQRTICGLISQNWVTSTYFDLPTSCSTIRSLQYLVNSFWISGEICLAFRGAFWRWFSKILSPPLTLYSTTKCPELVRPLFPTSGWLFVLSLWPLNGSNSFSSFFNAFFMCWIKDFVYWNLFRSVSSINLVSNSWLFLCIPVGAFWFFFDYFYCRWPCSKWLFVKIFQTRTSHNFMAE